MVWPNDGCCPGSFRDAQWIRKLDSIGENLRSIGVRSQATVESQDPPGQPRHGTTKPGGVFPFEKETAPSDGWWTSRLRRRCLRYDRSAAHLVRLANGLRKLPGGAAPATPASWLLSSVRALGEPGVCEWSQFVVQACGPDGLFDVQRRDNRGRALPLSAGHNGRLPMKHGSGGRPARRRFSRWPCIVHRPSPVSVARGEAKPDDRAVERLHD